MLQALTPEIDVVPIGAKRRWHRIPPLWPVTIRSSAPPLSARPASSGQGTASNLAPGHVQAAPFGPREGSLSARVVSAGGSSPPMPSSLLHDAVGAGAAGRTGSRSCCPIVSGCMNPWAAFSQDAETVKKTIEISVDSEDVGSFIVVLQAEILESYVDTLKSIDYWGKPIIACVAGKEFAMPDVIKMENASIPVLSTHRSRMANAPAIMYRHQKRVKELGAKV